MIKYITFLILNIIIINATKMEAEIAKDIIKKGEEIYEVK